MRRGQSRIPSNDQSSGGTRDEHEQEHDRLLEDEDEDEGEREGNIEKQKKRLLANCARLGLGMAHLSDDKDADLSLPTTTDITSASAEESPHPCCPTRSSWTSHSST